MIDLKNIFRQLIEMKKNMSNQKIKRGYTDKVARTLQQKLLDRGLVGHSLRELYQIGLLIMVDKIDEVQDDDAEGRQAVLEYINSFQILFNSPGTEAMLFKGDQKLFSITEEDDEVEISAATVTMKVKGDVETLQPIEDRIDPRVNRVSVEEVHQW